MKTEKEQRLWTAQVCPSGKRSFVTRKGAKMAARSLTKAGDPGTRPYGCDRCGHWHIGHKPRPVIHGEVSAADWFLR